MAKAKVVARTNVTARFWPVDDTIRLRESAHEKEVELLLEEDSKGKQTVRMAGGPTGQESFAVGERSESMMRGMANYGWLACFGTLNKVERCDVTGDEMRRGLTALGLLE